MFQNDPKTTEFFHVSLCMKHCNDHDYVLRIRHTKGKRATKSIQVFLLLDIFLPDLNRTVSHDLEKTELGLGT